jgi:GT2 family glycosyltransferase
MQPRISIVVVTFNSLPYIRECLGSVEKQSHKGWELVVIDNASTDGTREFLQQRRSGEIVLNERNVGFAAGQNQGIKKSVGEWVLALNPDVVLEPEFISKSVAAVNGADEIGTVCGKLLRWQPEAVEPFSRVLDSAGMYFRPDLRHLDRGAGLVDRGQYDQKEFVFGATGAASLHRRAMIEDISVMGEFFDEDFFSYREDADVAWRAQLMGWKCLYVDDAVGWHVRRVTPERRSQLPAEINRHSVKNRFLMRMKNAGIRLWLRFFVPMTVRDMMVLGYALFRDWRLLSAVWYPFGNWHRVLEKRKWIQQHRRVSDREMMRWFGWRPTSSPALPKKLQRIA